MKAFEAKPNILLVDDRPENLLALNAILRSPDYNLIDVPSGEAALKELLDRDFALIVMDVQMPGLSGFETAMLIKKRERSEFIPIIFVTASFMDEHSAGEGYKIGAVDYIIKPYNPDALKAKVKFFADYYRNNKKSQHQFELEREIQKVIEVVSHDLKNPLGSIKLNINLLQRLLTSGDSEKTLDILKNLLPKMFNAANHMQGLIDDLLDLAKMEGSQLQLEKNPVNMKSLLNEVVEILQPHADQKNIDINFQLQNNFMVNCDEERIKQVFSNLIGNAIKFSPNNGIISIAVFFKNQELTFKVQDNGPGIEQEDLPHLFERFWQSKNNSHKGTGIGLSITKWIVEAHGGKIWADSIPGKGTTFSFNLQQVQAL